GGARLWAFLVPRQRAGSRPVAGCRRSGTPPAARAGCPRRGAPSRPCFFPRGCLTPGRRGGHGDPAAAAALAYWRDFGSTRTRNAVDADRSLAAGTAGRSKGALILSTGRRATLPPTRVAPSPGRGRAGWLQRDRCARR